MRLAATKHSVFQNHHSGADKIPRFFNDLLSQPLDENFNGSFWHTMRAFYDGDAYPDLGLKFRFVDVAVSYLLVACPSCNYVLPLSRI